MSKKKFFSWLNPKNWFSGRKPKGSKDKENPLTGKDDSDNLSAEESQNDNTLAASTDDTTEVVKQESEAEATDLSIDELSLALYPYDNTNLTKREKYEKIVDQWNLKAEALQKLQQIYQRFPCEDGDFVSRVKEMVGNSPCQESAYVESGLYDKLISDIKSRIGKNKGLSRLLENAFGEKKDEGAKAVLTKFVQLLTSRYKEDSQSPISGGTIEVDNDLLDKNAKTVIGWLVSKLKIYSDENLGCIDPNSPEIAIKTIASRFKGNDEDRVKILLSEDAEIDKYANLIMPWLVRKINKLLRNENDHIDAIKPVDAIVYDISRAIEAAKVYEQLKNDQKQAAGKTTSSVDKPQKPVETGSETHNDQEVDYKTQIDELNRRIKDNREAANREKKDLEKKATDANKKVSEVVAELQALIKKDDAAEEQAASQTSEDKEASPVQLLKVYTKQTESVKAELTKEKTELSDKYNELESANTVLTDDNSKLKADLKGTKSVLKGEADALVDALQTGVNKVEGELEMPLVTPCNSDTDDFSSQSDEIEERLKSSLKQCLENLKTVKLEEGAAPDEVRKQIQKALSEAIEAEDSPIGTLCRYFAYSRMPFMTDPDRDESGIMFYRKNVFSLYKAVEDLYVRFGISFDLPPLFAMGIDEGNYGRSEGAEPDLNNLCPNCTNHRDNMDTHNKPQSVIYDIAEVGYSVDGVQAKKTGVITF